MESSRALEYFFIENLTESYSFTIKIFFEKFFSINTTTAYNFCTWCIQISYSWHIFGMFEDHYFGFSLVNHVTHGDSSWLLVGSPATGSNFSFFLKFIIFRGAHSISKSGFFGVLYELQVQPHGRSYVDSVSVASLFIFMGEAKDRYRVPRLKQRQPHLAIQTSGRFGYISQNVAIIFLELIHQRIVLLLISFCNVSIYPLNFSRVLCFYCADRICSRRNGTST